MSSFNSGFSSVREENLSHVRKKDPLSEVFERTVRCNTSELLSNIMPTLSGFQVHIFSG
jgi:hypothetical protein